VTYGSSGNFFRQIGQDAPFELFLSADEGFVFQLAYRSLTLDRGVLYGVGRIVLFVPKGAPLRADAALTARVRALPHLDLHRRRDGRGGDPRTLRIGLNRRW
jgi:molybdate transport system substrate-binding protein